MRLVIALVAAFGSAAAPVPETVMSFQGGSFDGLTAAKFIKADGRVSLGFLPSAKGASPVPPQVAAPVAGLIAAYRADRPQDYPRFVEPMAISYSGCALECERKRNFLAAGFPMAERCRANEPYYAGYAERLGEAVRIEWLCGDDQELWYLTFLHVRNGKIWRLNTVRAEVPPVTSQAH